MPLQWIMIGAQTIKVVVLKLAEAERGAGPLGASGRLVAHISAGELLRRSVFPVGCLGASRLA